MNRAIFTEAVMSLKFLVSMVVSMLALYAGIRVVPVLFTNFEFQDDVRQAALFGAYHQDSEDQIAADLQQRAHTLGLPVGPDQIQVYRSDRGLVIDVDFDVQISLPWHPVNLHFRDQSVQQAASWY